MANTSCPVDKQAEKWSGRGDWARDRIGFSTLVTGKGSCRGATSDISQTRQCLVRIVKRIRPEGTEETVSPHEGGRTLGNGIHGARGNWVQRPGGGPKVFHSLPGLTMWVFAGVFADFGDLNRGFFGGAAGNAFNHRWTQMIPPLGRPTKCHAKGFSPRRDQYNSARHLKICVHLCSSVVKTKSFCGRTPRGRTVRSRARL